MLPLDITPQSGIEYLVSTTDEWVSSSTSRFIQPELVELYEWLNSSGFREGDDALPTVIRPKVAVPKGTKMRTTSSNGYPSQPLKKQQKEEQQQEMQENKEPRKHSAPEEDENQEPDSEQSRQAKKQRLEGSYIEELGHLKISNDTPDQDDSDKEKESTTEFTTTALPSSVSTSNQPYKEKKSAADSTETPSAPTPPQLMEFNRNTEQMVEVYFKEGMGNVSPRAVICSHLATDVTVAASNASECHMVWSAFDPHLIRQLTLTLYPSALDASGVDMFDVVLGPYRRPTKYGFKQRNNNQNAVNPYSKR